MKELLDSELSLLKIELKARKMKDPRTPCLGVQRKNNQKNIKFQKAEFFNYEPPSPFKNVYEAQEREKGS